MKIRERNEDGELGEYKKIDPNSKTKDEIIADLQAENASLNQQLAQVNGNLSGFIDQYYIDNPDKA